MTIAVCFYAANLLWPLRRRSWRFRRGSAGRSVGGSTRASSRLGRSSDGGLSIVRVHQSLSNVAGSTRPEHGSGLRVGDVQDHAIAVRGCVLLHHVQHLPAQPVQDFLFRLLDLVLIILVIALQGLCLRLNGFGFGRSRVFTERGLLSLVLLLETFDLIVQSFEFG